MANFNSELTDELIAHKYVLLFDESEPTNWFVRLTDKSGIWKGIIFSYGKVQLSENGNIKFEWELHYAPEHLKNVKTDDKILSKSLEQTLSSVLLHIFKTYGEKLSRDEKTGKVILGFTKNDIER